MQHETVNEVGNCYFSTIFKQYIREIFGIFPHALSLFTFEVSREVEDERKSISPIPRSGRWKSRFFLRLMT